MDGKGGGEDMPTLINLPFFERTFNSCIVLPSTWLNLLDFFLTLLGFE